LACQRFIPYFDSRLKISLEKRSRQIQAESSDFILNPAPITNDEMS